MLKPKATFRLISIFPSLDSKDIHLYTTTRRRTITKVEQRNEENSKKYTAKVVVNVNDNVNGNVRI